MAKNRIILSAKVSAVQDLIAVYRFSPAVRITPSISASLRPAWAPRDRRLSAARASSSAGHRRHHPHFADARAGGDRTARCRSARNCCRPGFPHLSCRWSRPARMRPHHFDHVPGTGALVQDSSADEMRPGKPNIRRRGAQRRRDGCIVNGPANPSTPIWISLTGTGEAPAAPVFVDGKKIAPCARPNHLRRLPGAGDRYIDQRYAQAPKRRRL